MLTKDDKKFISVTIGGAIVKNNEVLRKEFKNYATKQEMRTMFINFAKEIIDFISPSLKKIDSIDEELKNHNDDIDNHERRIEKLEEKVFAT